MVDYGRNEEVARAVDELMTEGVIRVDAKDALNAEIVARIIADGVRHTDTGWTDRNGVALKDAIRKRVETDKPQWGVPKIENALQAQALAGNVSAHGRLYKELGDVAYKTFCETHGAAPGKVAATAVEHANGGAKKVSASNPWSKAGWSLKKQGELLKAVGEVKAEQIATAAGCKIGSVRPNAAFN